MTKRPSWSLMELPVTIGPNGGVYRHRYVSSDNTNIRKRFADIRYQQILEKREREEGLAPDAPNIIPLRKAEP